MTHPEAPAPFQDETAGEPLRQSESVTRWVAPVKSQIPRTKPGLLDFAALSDDWYVGDRPQRADDLIGTRNSYVLLAPGGAGKTTLIDDLKRREPASITIDLRLHDRRSLVEELDSLISGESSPHEPSKRTVFIDAVDGALQVDSEIEYVLVQLLSRPGANRMAWRFACRPGAWTVGLAKGLNQALPGFEELELLPLSLADVRELAGTDADHFLNAVDHARLTRLLAYPLHVRNLLDPWRVSGQLPVSRAEAMQHAVTRMLTETSNIRPPGKLDDHRRRLIAERLAATSMFCGVGTFALGPVAPQRADGSSPRDAGNGVVTSVLAVTAVPTQPEPDLPTLNVEDIREVLHTSLFVAAGHGTVAFAHQSYAEFLAAEYLRRRSAAGQRLTSLMGADVNGLVPAPMIEVLGWLVASGAPVLDTLIPDNAKQLLSTAGLELADDIVRERVVEALLRGAAVGTIGDGWRTDTSVLSHPGLAAQLREAAECPSNDWVIFWICRIARQCVVIEVANDLLAIAFDPAWHATMRAEAVNAFTAVAPRHQMAQLMPLLGLSSDEDPHDEILAAALRAMLPDVVDFAQVQNALRPRRSPNYFGSYAQLLIELPSLIPGNQILPALTDALDRRSERDDGAFDRLIGGLLQRAWQAKDPAICEAIGAALSTELLSAHQLFPNQLPPWQTDDDLELRRAMATSALATHPKAYYAVLEMRMLTPADLGWILDWMLIAPEPALEPARVALRNLAWNVADADSASRILDTDENHPAYEVLTTFRGHQELSARPDWLATENKEGPDLGQLESELRDAITHARNEIDDWWIVVVALVGDQTNLDTEVLFGWDLTSRPMWSTMTGEEQEEFLRLGLGYLRATQPDVSRWVGLDSFALDDVMPDWAGIFLLATIAAHRPDLLTNVAPSTWSAWASAIICTPNFTGAETWKRTIRDGAPEEGRDAIDAAFREQIEQADSTSFAYHPLANFSDKHLIAVVERLARDPDNPEVRRDEALYVLIEHAPAIALDVARTATNEGVVFPAVFAAIAKLAPDELVTEWIAQNQLGPTKCLRGLDPQLLSDDTLVALTSMLLDSFPFAEDSDQSNDFTEDTEEADARRLRTHLLQSMASRGMASQLVAIGQGCPEPDLEQIRYAVREARAREALAKWQPVQPGTFMGLLARGDARLIRDSAGLLTVLLEQLDQIQHDIHGLATFRGLWDREPGTEGASPKNEDTISDWLKEQLRLRLQPHIIVDREIQVTRPKAGGIGTRIDITATSGGVNLGRVVFEAKLVNNSELLTAIDEQLVDRYMEPAELTHSIYIVYWTAPDLRPPSWHKKHPDPKALAEELLEQAERHLPNKRIEIVVLDIGPAA